MNLHTLKKAVKLVKLQQIIPLIMIKGSLKKKLKDKQQSIKETDLSSEELAVINKIRAETRKHNVNNVTRTQAYYDFYREYPEIHWALLGHMVSRNGGWNMTDLKGEWLSKLLSKKEQQDFFHFLERGNWLIFQDVYPQFMLYKESKEKGKNMFYLLPIFHVSKFMETMWEYFWYKSDRYLLAIGMVINEQKYLEKRVVQNPLYQSSVLKTMQFKLQDILSLNQILFPLTESLNEGSPDQQKGHKLLGTTLHHFASLNQRILLGKRLYELLFHEQHLQKILSWASQTSHSGSRKDYWSHIFNDVNASDPGIPYKNRLQQCQLKPGSSRIYSPELQHAWPNVEHNEAEIGDWFDDWKVIVYLKRGDYQINGEIINEYCETLEKIELAVIGKTFLSK